MNNRSNNNFLTDDERGVLKSYLKLAEDDAPYYARVRLLLLHDNGTTPELAAAQLGITIPRARGFIKAFSRERMGLFPANLFQTKSTQE